MSSDPALQEDDLAHYVLVQHVLQLLSLELFQEHLKGQNTPGWHHECGCWCLQDHVYRSVTGCTFVLPIWYVVGLRPIFFSSSAEMSSLQAVAFFGSKTLNCSMKSCRNRKAYEYSRWSSFHFCFSRALTQTRILTSNQHENMNSAPEVNFPKEGHVCNTWNVYLAP